VQQIPLGVRLADRAVFGSFLPAHNAEALQHLQRLSSGAACTLTWLCGPRGSGKTHLLQATCAAASEQVRAGYVPLAEVAPLGVGVLDGLPQMQCLCLDDLDRVAGQLDWERGIFGLLREIDEGGARLVVTAQVPPALLDFALPDLGSRCAAAAVFQLHLLQEEEQRAALQLRARLRGLELPDETWDWLRKRFPRDMRTLYQLLDRLDEAALAAQRRLTVPFIREVLRSARVHTD
jgi:DnaA-homolog protein